MPPPQWSTSLGDFRGWVSAPWCCCCRYLPPFLLWYTYARLEEGVDLMALCVCCVCCCRKVKTTRSDGESCSQPLPLFWKHAKTRGETIASRHWRCIHATGLVATLHSPSCSCCHRNAVFLFLVPPPSDGRVPRSCSCTTPCQSMSLRNATAPGSAHVLDVSCRTTWRITRRQPGWRGWWWCQSAVWLGSFTVMVVVVLLC